MDDQPKFRNRWPLNFDTGKRPINAARGLHSYKNRKIPKVAPSLMYLPPAPKCRPPRFHPRKPQPEEFASRPHQTHQQGNAYPISTTAPGRQGPRRRACHNRPSRRIRVRERVEGCFVQFRDVGYPIAKELACPTFKVQNDCFCRPD